MYFCGKNHILLFSYLFVTLTPEINRPFTRLLCGL